MDPEMLVEDVCRTLEQLPQPIGQLAAVVYSTRTDVIELIHQHFPDLEVVASPLAFSADVMLICDKATALRYQALTEFLAKIVEAAQDGAYIAVSNEAYAPAIHELLRAGERLGSFQIRYRLITHRRGYSPEGPPMLHIGNPDGSTRVLLIPTDLLPPLPLHRFQSQLDALIGAGLLEDAARTSQTPPGRVSLNELRQALEELGEADRRRAEARARAYGWNSYYEQQIPGEGVDEGVGATIDDLIDNIDTILEEHRSEP